MTQTAIVINTNLAKPKHYQNPTLENRLLVALEHARRLTAMFELPNQEVAIAWETVEELRAEQVRQRATRKTPLALYCEANPSAPECRIYED
jgi:hypothetical protein